YLSQTPVTQAQWQAVMGSNPARFQGETLPIETVSWHDCMAFCAQTAVCSRYSLRLPSEAEWEYACRAGSATAYSFGDSENDLAAHGWYRGNAEHCSHPVATRKPNAWGLYDMHGGIDEFCLDVWHEDANGDYAGAPTDGSVWDEGGDVRYRVLRGGSWYDQGVHCRSPHRNYYAADVPTEDHGFRLVWIHDDR